MGVRRSSQYQMGHLQIAILRERDIGLAARRCFQTQVPYISNDADYRQPRHSLCTQADPMAHRIASAVELIRHAFVENDNRHRIRRIPVRERPTPEHPHVHRPEIVDTDSILSGANFRIPGFGRSTVKSYLPPLRGVGHGQPCSERGSFDSR